MPDQHIQSKDNPFCHYLNLTRCQKLQVFIMSFTIAPLRAAMALMLFGVAWTLTLIFTLGADISKPASYSRRCLYQCLQMAGRFIMFVCGFHHIKINGKRAAYEEAPVLIVVPHSSYWDVVIFFVTSPMPCALSKFENFHLPIFGTLMKAVQPILVRRNDKDSRLDTVDAIKSRLASKQPWPQLIVFPEGTCTNRKFMLKFKLGAFLAGTAIQPVVMKYKNSMDVSTWTEVSPRALYLIWLSLCQIRLNLEVDYLPVYKPSTREKNDPIVYAQNMQKYLSKILDVECCNHTYEDRVLMKYAGKLKFPKTEAFILFHNVKKTLGITLADAMERLKEFASISSPSDGKIDVESFSTFLNMPITPSVEKLFDMLSCVSGEKVTFYQYIMEYYSLVHKIKTEPVLSTVYNIYCKLKESKNVTTKNNITTVNALLELFDDSKVTSKESFLEFLKTHPFHCKLLLLENETLLFQSGKNANDYVNNLMRRLLNSVKTAK